MNVEKEQIIQALYENQYEGLSKTIPAYLDKYPYDVDMYVIAGYYFLLREDFDRAGDLLHLSLKYNYYDVDTYFLLGDLYFFREDYLQSVEYYARADNLHLFYQKEYLFYSKGVCEEKLARANAALENIIELHPEEIQKYNQGLKNLSLLVKNGFWFFSDIIRLPEHIFGTMVYAPDDEQRYCGYFHTLGRLAGDCMSKGTLSLLRGELLKISYQGKDFIFQTDNTVLLPIASREKDSSLNVSLDSGESFRINQFYGEHFNYYRVSRGLRITSEEDFVVGEPVLLSQKRHLKKLVLSFFVDGLSQQLIREEGLENVMPHTWEFFSKGLVCENFFTTSDWTYPSLPSFISGCSVPEHMMIHPDINRPLPDDHKRLFTYMKEAGYYTAMFSGGQRTSSTFGYTRDVDRYVAQSTLLYNAKQLIPDVMEHIHAFRETNQYLWITVSDLHDIADEIDLSLDTVAQIDIRDRKVQEKSITSVKQNYSPEKRKAYIQALQAVDLQFASLYQYIEENYQEDEFVFTMFGDHGQAYFVKPGEHHLSGDYANVGFLVRGGGLQGKCTEYMSATDYSHILCELAGTSAFQSTDGHLPKTFGGTWEREFTVTETIHPGDPYMASIHAPDHVFYYTSDDVLSPDGRLVRGGCQKCLVDKAGQPMENKALVQKYTETVEERLRYIYVY